MAWEKLSFSNSKSILLPGLLSVIWGALLFRWASLTNFNEPYIPFGIAGALAFCLRAAPSRKEIYGVLVATATFAAVVHFPSVPFWVLSVSSCMALPGFGALLILGLRAFWSEPLGRSNALVLLGESATLILFLFVAQHALRTTGVLHPKTYDLWLFVTDGSLGFQPSFFMGRVLLDNRILTISALLTYDSLPFVMAAVCAWHIPVGATRPPWFILTLFMVAGVGGWLLYDLLPATGPVYVFTRDFPWTRLPYSELHKILLETVAIAPGIPRNAIPSLHMGWVILLVWNSRKFVLPARVFMLLYLVLTLVATLGTGQHYLIDLIVSLPFALLIQCLVSLPLSAIRFPRIIAIVVSLCLIAAWFAMIRFGVPFLLRSPAIPWALMLFTIVVTIWLENWTRKKSENSKLLASS
jgi:PAP2 superfamily protein